MLPIKEQYSVSNNEKVMRQVEITIKGSLFKDFTKKIYVENTAWNISSLLQDFRGIRCSCYNSVVCSMLG